MTTPDAPRILLGAYALGTLPDATRWFEALSGLDVDGLEHPLTPDDGPDTDAALLSRHLPAAWDLMVTCIPTAIARLSHGPGYGLASDDEAGRAAAIADVRRALRLADELAQLAGRPRVLAVEVHSAPGPRGGSASSLARSLAALTDDDEGPRLVVEHCDRLVDGQAPAKGFLSLDDELAAVRRVAAPSRLGVGLNWGRSAIEGRGTALPVAHARTAAASGLLHAAVLSGATDRAGAWGPAWSDAHIPPRGDDPALAASADSLLGVREAADFLAAAGPVPIVAAKVACRPADLDVPGILAVADATLDMLREALG
jgi:sugar phosphate isomerase/epimerase